MECITVTPQQQQDQHADIAGQRHADILRQAGLLALLLAGAHRENEERHTAGVAQHHHGQVQPIVSTHHAAVEHAQNRGVVGDGERQLRASARDHQTLHGFVFPDDLQILADLDLLAGLAADAEVLGLILLPDADDGQDGQRNGHHNAHGGQRAEEARGGIAALIVFGKDGSQELHNAHAQQTADGVEDREQRALLGIVGQNRLTGTGAAGLEGIADDPDRIQGHKGGVAQAHRAGGDEGGQTVQHENAGRHDEVADDHEGPELAKSAVGAVHQRADDGVSNGVKQAHAGDHYGGKDHAQGQNLAAESGNVGKHQNIVHVGSAVVKRKQHQLVRLGAVDAGRRRRVLFTHGGILLS